MSLSDFPKIHSPFIREEYPIDKGDWRKHGRRLQLRKPSVYLVINKLNPGYEWVFDHSDTIAIEKLDGSNVKLETSEGRLTQVQNRKNIIDPLQIIKGQSHYMEGIFQSIGKGYIEKEGIQAGELIGPKLQGNPYQLDQHLWYPFAKAIKHLKYRSFHDHERNLTNWSIWFEKYIHSLFLSKRGIKSKPEGIVFYNLRRKAENKVYMAKLRRDMFDWYYKDVEIIGYEKDY